MTMYVFRRNGIGASNQIKKRRQAPHCIWPIQADLSDIYISVVKMSEQDGI